MDNTIHNSEERGFQRGLRLAKEIILNKRESVHLESRDAIDAIFNEIQNLLINSEKIKDWKAWDKK